MNVTMSEYVSTDRLDTDFDYEDRDIIDRGADLSQRMEAAKAAFDQFLIDLDTHRHDTASRKAKINEAELSGKIDSRAAVMLMRDLAEQIEQKKRETKERLKQRSAEIAQFDKEAATIRWAEKRLKLRNAGKRSSFTSAECWTE